MSKFLTTILIISILTQIIFSFFYSSEIINQNDTLFKNQQKLEQLRLVNQTLVKELAQVSSLNNIQKQIDSQNLIPVTQKIDLSQP